MKSYWIVPICTFEGDTLIASYTSRALHGWDFQDGLPYGLATCSLTSSSCFTLEPSHEDNTPAESPSYRGLVSVLQSTACAIISVSCPFNPVTG